MWDCCGSEQANSCWPALTREAHGVIFVFNPGSSEQARLLDSAYTSVMQGEHKQGTKKSNIIPWMSNCY